MKVPRSKSSRERKFQGTKDPHLELSLLGANGLGSEKSSYPHYSGPQELGGSGSLNRLNPQFLRHCDGVDIAMCEMVCACVSVWQCLGGWVCTMKTADQNDLKLGTVVVLNTVSQPTPLGSQRQGLRSGYRVECGFGFKVRVGVYGCGWGCTVRV